MKYKVRDGEVGVGDYVWWHCEEGPRKLKVTGYEPNIRGYPEFHSIEKPTFVQHPTIEWKVVYEHEDEFKHFKHLREGRKVVKTKHERKRPEFTFEDGVYLGQDYDPSSGYLLITMEHPRLYTVQQKISAARDYLKEKSWQSCYYFKPLRKKLKLYVKWLQSEMSKQGE